MGAVICRLPSLVACLVILVTGLGPSVVSPLQAQPSAALPGDPVTIHVLDVGFGAATLIRTPHGKWVVVDGGPSRFLADSAVPRYGVDRFALVVLSHRHVDHWGGLSYALATIPADTLVADISETPTPAYKRMTDLVRAKRLTVRAPRLDTLTIDGVRFIIIPPPPVPDNENNNSTVVRLEYGQFSMLFPGDAEERERDWLVTQYGRALHSSVLLAAYHGSIRGTSKAWLEAVSPSAIVIPVNDRPSFRLPNGPAVEEYIRQVGDNRVYCTNRQGTILIHGYADGRSAVRPERLRKNSCAFGADTLKIAVRGDSLIDYRALYTLPSSAGRTDRHLRPHVVINSGGMRFVPTERLFRGSFLLGLIDSVPGNTHSLDKPVKAQLSSAADEVAPELLTLDHVNVPYQKVIVTSRSPGDSVLVQIFPDIDPTGLSVTLQVTQTVMADASAKRVLGFGLQSAIIGVRLLGGFLDSVEVDVSAAQGGVTNRRAIVHRGRSHDVAVRSSGLGVDSIRVTSTAGFDVIAIKYTWPTLFLLGAVLGGGIGAFVRQRNRGREKAGLREVVKGALVGVLIAAGYAVAVNLLRIQIYWQGVNEAAVFFIAGMATFLPGFIRAPKQGEHEAAPAEDDEDIRILFLSANPSQTSRLDLEEELRSLEQELRGVRFRDTITLTARHAVRPDDLIRFVRAEKPNVIHFSGHGSKDGIVLRDDAGGYQAVEGASLKRFLQGRGVDLVVLNACYSQGQASTIHGAVKVVVGTTDAVDDEAARRFTVAFYRSLGEGLSVREAFRDGGDAVALHGLVDVFHSEGDLNLALVRPRRPFPPTNP
jgi:competence protein ComEC